MIEHGASAWSFTAAFRPIEARPQLDADFAPELRRAAENVWRATEGPLRDALAAWDARLAELGSDPSRRDWSRFRPLALSREEGWSDWLAYLLETSEAGTAASRLFRRAASDSCAPRFDRELSLERATAGRRRADVVLRWTAAEHTHIEVKIGDRALEKTWETAALLEAALGGTWSHFVLLLPDQAPEFEEARDARPAGAIAIGVLTWADVAIAFRRGITDVREPVGWRAMACVFVGCVEQILLRFDHVARTLDPRRPERLRILLEALDERR